MSATLVDESWTDSKKEPGPIREFEREVHSGLAALILSLVLLIGGVGLLIVGAGLEAPLPIIAGLIIPILGMFGLGGLFIVNPNEAKLLQLFGAYRGTVRSPGLCWASPVSAPPPSGTGGSRCSARSPPGSSPGRASTRDGARRWQRRSARPLRRGARSSTSLSAATTPAAASRSTPSGGGRGAPRGSRSRSTGAASGG